jgi:hypothetical protein
MSLSLPYTVEKTLENTKKDLISRIYKKLLTNQEDQNKKDRKKRAKIK